MRSRITHPLPSAGKALGDGLSALLEHMPQGNDIVQQISHTTGVFFSLQVDQELLKAGLDLLKGRYKKNMLESHTTKGLISCAHSHSKGDEEVNVLEENWFNVFQAMERHGAALVRYMQVILRKLQERHQPLRHHGTLHMILPVRSRAKTCPFCYHQLPGRAGRGGEETCVWLKEECSKEKSAANRCFWRCGAEVYKFASQKASTQQKTTLLNGLYVVCQIWKHAAGSCFCTIQAIQYPN